MTEDRRQDLARAVEPLFADARARIAASVRRLRKERDWTLEDVSWYSGISLKAVGFIEQARANLELATITRLAMAFEVDLAELVRPIDPDVPVEPVRIHRRKRREY